MSWSLLVLRGMRFHWRTHLGALAGASLATAILVGALAVGDSVRYSLRQMALARLGGVHLALNAQNRFFRANLAQDIGRELSAPTAAAILLRGAAATESGDRRVGPIHVWGVDRSFWRLHSAADPGEDDGLLLVNERLASRLGARKGDELLLRVDKPSLLSRDAPLSTLEDASAALRLRISGILPDSGLGRFSLEANQTPPLNAFVAIRALQTAIGMRGRANALLVGASASASPVQAAATALWKRWDLQDASLELRDLPQQKALELRTDRVFLDEPVAEAGLKASPMARSILTYFVNEIRNGSRATPYSIVTAMDTGALVSALRDEEILINRWLAEDLGASPGDRIALRYYVVGHRRALEERTSEFTVRAVVPIAGAAADPELMPLFPGLADRENCRDWEPGIPVDLKRIRNKDEAYWDAYRGTPKAFVTLSAGRRMWSNRFGSTTAIRYPRGPQSAESVAACIRQSLNPALLGLAFMPVRELGLRASTQGTDFGLLFVGFSLFLIAAALLLTALLFGFGVEQRREEMGTLLAMGFRPAAVCRLFLAEGALVAALAALLGTAAAGLYTRAVIHGLSTVWRDAVSESLLQYHAGMATLAGGALLGFLASLFAVWLVARRLSRITPRELILIAPESETPISVGGGRWAAAAAVSAVAAVAVAAAGMARGGASAAGFLFGAGALLLIAGVAAVRALLLRMGSVCRTEVSVTLLGARGAARRPGRSLAAVALLACGSFLVLAVGASRHDPAAGAAQRDSGTGGFALYAESALPIFQDMNMREGREELGLELDESVSVAPFRLREGDDASCLNLNRAQTPRILGVDPAELSRRRAFGFTKLAPGIAQRDPWLALEQREKPGEIPAIGDVNTVVWSLGKGVGDAIDVMDGHGKPLRLRIIGVIGNSVLQGALIIAEDRFVERFPEESGYRVFLIDTPEPQKTGPELTRALEDFGLTLVSSTQRLADFSVVENTYLNIFAILGGFGVLLGSAGLGIIVLRNMLERRGELAMLRALGFTRKTLRRLALSEHALVLILGLAVGTVAGLAAVLPALLSPGAGVPAGSLALTLTAVFVSGFLWTALAAWAAVRGPLNDALRNE